jgi:putative ATPase
MLEAGEDPLYIARRLIRFASEDIGNAKVGALILANTVYDVCQKIGMPECRLSLIQLVLYMADSPRDNYAYKVEDFMLDLVSKFGNLPVPLHFRNPTTHLLKNIGYGSGYKYDHNEVEKRSEQQCWPDKLEKRFKGSPPNIDAVTPKAFRE